MASTLDLTPRTALARGVGSNADTIPVHDYTAAGSAFTRATQPDYFGWLEHVRAAAGCTRPDPPRRPAPHRRTRHRPGPRRPAHRRHARRGDLQGLRQPPRHRLPRLRPAPTNATPTNSCAPASSAAKASPTPSPQHPAVFATFTAPVLRHRAHPGGQAAHLRATANAATAGPTRATPAATDPPPALRPRPPRRLLGPPRDRATRCSDSRCAWTATTTTHQVVWNLFSGELWHRTKQAAERMARQTRPPPGHPPRPRRHRLRQHPQSRHRSGCRTGRSPSSRHAGRCTSTPWSASTASTPTTPTAVIPPPAGFTVADLDDAIRARRRAGRLHHPDPPRPARRLVDRLG